MKKRNIKKTAAREIKKKVRESKPQESKPLRKRRLKRTKKELKRKRRPTAIQLIRSEENPIITPKPEHDWEAWQTFNPGVILLDGKVHFLYRAVGQDGISRLGYASSNDGFTIDERLPHPVYEHQLTDPRPSVFNYYSFASGGSFGGAEDPRIVRVNDEDTLYMTYTACDQGLRVALTSIKVEDFLQKKWRWKSPKLISPPGEVHKNWVIFPEKIKVSIWGTSLQSLRLHRPSARNIFRKLLKLSDKKQLEQIQLINTLTQNSQYAILHSISPKISIAYRDTLEFQEGEYIQSYYDGRNPRENCWDSWVRGTGAPPLKTKKGWLLFYHAIEGNDFGEYKVGAMLLDLQDPTKVLHRSPEPILEPEEDYENNGFKRGVVYVSGAVIKDGELLVYYGASDSYIGVAHANLEEFIEALTKGVKPKLKTKPLKKKK